MSAGPDVLAYRDCIKGELGPGIACASCVDRQSWQHIAGRTDV